VALSPAQRRVLAALADGEWHFGARTCFRGDVTSGPAIALVDRGLAERRGESRGPKPNASGFEYRLTPAGRELAERQATRVDP
jgi:hypothetical protein